MHPIPTQCPICGGEVIITRLQCRQCETALEGRFIVSGTFAGLTLEQLRFVETFVRYEGKLSRMEGELGLSYPTIRNRLHDVIRAMGYEPGESESEVDISTEQRRQILEDLDAGKISYQEALKRLEGQEA